MGPPPVGRRRPVLLALVIATFVMFVLAPAAGASGYSTSQLGLVRMINQVRAAHVLPPLRIDPKLQRAARAHSIDMLQRGYFGHGAFVTRIRSYGVRSRFVGENLAWGTGSSGNARSVLRMWLRSPEHRSNLLRPSFRRIGLGMPVGTFSGYRLTHMVTADFAG